MAICYEKLNLWSEAYLLRKEIIKYFSEQYEPYREGGPKHSELPNREEISISSLYAKAVYDLAILCKNIKNYEGAIILLEPAILLRQILPVDSRPNTIEMQKELDIIRELSERPHRESIDVGHDYRICNNCEKIIKNMDSCTACFKVSYCNADCQLEDWSFHKPFCYVCISCDTPLDRDSKIMRCSKCKKAKYCNVECQKKDWKDHKNKCLPVDK
jgi:MYND finger